MKKVIINKLVIIKIIKGPFRKFERRKALIYPKSLTFKWLNNF